jgi:methylmalonyl-CoA carboxyltransferase small subunit
MKLEMLIGGKPYQIEMSVPGEAPARGKRRKLLQSSILPTAHADGDGSDGNVRVCRSPLSGIIAGVHVHAGDELQTHDLMLVLEAMKMQTKLTAPRAGKLKRVHVSPGEAVKRDQVLVEFE